jgi:hypothetical protein
MRNPLEKTMSLTLAEFAHSFARLDPDSAVQLDRQFYNYPVGDGAVEIRVTPIEPARLGGGLLALPRCQVVLSFSGATAADEATFLSRFDRVFQRGGG